MVTAATEELLKVIERMQGTPVLVCGDVMLDRYIWGKVDRISAEAPVPVVDVGRTEDRLGGAGNVVRNLQGIGIGVSLCGFVGDDDEGKTVLELLGRDGVNKDGVIVDRNKPTTLKTRVIAHHQQVVRIDREKRGASSKALEEALAAVVDSHIEENKALIISDYGKGAVPETVLRRVEGAMDAGRLGLGIRPLMVDPHPRNYGTYRRMSIAKPNRKEAEVATGVAIESVSDAFKAARVLLTKWNAELMIVSLGEDGLVIVGAAKDSEIHLETTAQEVFDVSGAGDAITAVFTAALVTGASPVIAGVLANIAAGVVVSEVGTVAITADKLRAAVQRLGAVTAVVD